MSGREDMSHFLPTFTLLAAVGSVAGVSFSFSWSVLMSCLGGGALGRCIDHLFDVSGKFATSDRNVDSSCDRYNFDCN